MKKRILLIVVFEILFMSILGRKIDYYLIEKNNYPIFSFPLAIYKDGGTKIFYGISYKIISLQSLSINSKGIMGYTTGTIILNWFQNVDLDTYLNENTLKFTEENKYNGLDNGINVLVSFVMYLQLFICVFLLIRRKK